MSSWNDWIGEELHELDVLQLKRECMPVRNAQLPVLSWNGKKMFNFSSNNYLGLAAHPKLKEAICRGTVAGSGGVASRLIIGHSEETELLEREIARFKKTEKALLFPNGYMANVGMLTALVTSKDAVFSDQYNHASIVDGIRLSGARLFRYRHLDLNHLEKRLKSADQKGVRHKLIITDSVFSMDGDVAPLRELVRIKEKYGAALVIDEAHGAGVFGPRGQGMAHELGVHEEIDLHMGTFSKAFGVYGAYVAGKKEWISLLVNRARSLIYTTALPPAIVSANRMALRLVTQADQRRGELKEKTVWFRKQLMQKGFAVGNSSTQIIPLYLGENARALAFSESLRQRGVFALAIRPPTVPVHTARLRFSLMANHSWEQLEQTLGYIEQVNKTMRR
ncbi:8-amino-7-oxononanoate synthase [Thermoactinomyces mirandus]|uniref:8-amino-7-ketopelargonate synthase n=1 Tax=Thermoactinomyces mirandus TaxID=2756294 RepID=A0A7W1XS76_9BACL|nr:8-amino-7-oxononanoate synthase [Thermoactinomyces mirandus]MBA4602177.1 8-amino-7-oxononanoate synthase [Thermoactinomyces mirandus]